MLVFSEQNVIKDPSFSRLDLISCRNLLIYMGSELQKKVIPMFHHALKPEGYLFLGTSETVGEFSDQFIPLDRQAKLYQRKDDLYSPDQTTRSSFQPPLTATGVSLPHLVGNKAIPQDCHCVN